MDHAQDFCRIVLQQREADIPTLTDRLNALNRQADKIKSDADQKISELNSLDSQLRYSQSSLDRSMKDLSAATEAAKPGQKDSQNNPNIDEQINLILTS
jgi:septal ring factor EnvC (AmiA/AmiB activator)